MVRSRELAGFALALSTGVAFALANTLASIAYHGGSNPETVAATRFILPALALYVWFRMRGMRLRLPGREGWVAAGLGVITAIYTWALLSAIGAIPLALAILLFYLFPLVATVILGVCGWEKLGWRTILAIVLALAGLALALDPRGGNLNAAGVALAFLGALGLGTVIATSSRLFHSGDSRPVTFCMATVAALLLIGTCLASGTFMLPQTGLGWTSFVGSAAFYAFAMITFFVAISMIGPVSASLMSYVEPIVAAGLGMALLGERLSAFQVIGIAIVIAALIAAARWRTRG